MHKISIALAKWYNTQKHIFPWRENSSTYSVWISEIMLQQTQVSTATPYFNSWMNKFPCVKSVAKAQIDDILKVWEGLGYYQRAHNIFFTAQTITNKYKGVFPKTYDELIQLKGVGDYTASAIMSIAYNKPYPSIDGNLKRVIARLCGINDFNTIVEQSKKYISNLMIYKNPSIINQSLMDLGREVCTPKNPKCIICPINTFCIGFNNNLIEKFSIKPKTKKIPIFDVSVGLIMKNNNILISKRKKAGLLGGLWELPGGKLIASESFKECLKREVLEELDIKIKIINKIGTIKHQYSHFKINMCGFKCKIKSGAPKPLVSDGIKWINFNEIKKYAFPKATLKLFNIVDND
jgi:A/G-specific adenine glycosylase